MRQFSSCFIANFLRYLHESGLAIIYGLGVGLLLRVLGSSRGVHQLTLTASGTASNTASRSGLQNVPPEQILVTMNLSASSLDRSSTSFEVEEKTFSYGLRGQASSGGGPQESAVGDSGIKT